MNYGMRLACHSSGKILPERAGPEDEGTEEMVSSVNVNTGALIALQNLNKTTKLLEVSQLRITTGLKVNGPKDNAASFAIAQRFRGDIKGIESVKIALATGDSIANVAVTAGQSISDLLNEMKAKAVQANQAGLDSASRSALHSDFTALRDQITTIVSSASFNNKNLITSGATALSVLSSIDGSTITVSAQSLDITALGISSSSLANSSAAATALTSINSAISLGLLLGRVPLDRLKDLLKVVDSRRTAFTDPKLTAILDEIELRAKVELAKLGQI